MRARVFVTRQIPAAGLDAILAATEAVVWPHELPPSRHELLLAVRGVEGLLCLLTDRVDAELIHSAGPRLRVISQMAVGYDNIDVAAATSRGIPVGNTPGVLTETTADFTWALLLATARRVVEGMQTIPAGAWQTWHPMGLLGPDVHGATLGIVGLGKIGAAVARRARGFAMRVLATTPRPKPDLAAEVGAEEVALERLLAESDFVSLHCPLTPETRHLIDAQTLRRMKPGAILINTARGGVVDQRALLKALQTGVIAGAGLDVTDPEPMAADDPLLRLPNVVVTPHIASASIQTRDRMARMAADNLLAGLRGEKLPHCVNPEVQEGRGLDLGEGEAYM